MTNTFCAKVEGPSIFKLIIRTTVVINTRINTENIPLKIWLLEKRLVNVIIAKPNGNAPILTRTTDNAVAEPSDISELAEASIGCNIFLIDIATNKIDT